VWDRAGLPVDLQVHRADLGPDGARVIGTAVTVETAMDVAAPGNVFRDGVGTSLKGGFERQESERLYWWNRCSRRFSPIRSASCR